MTTEIGARIQLQTVLKKGALKHLTGALRSLNLPGGAWETSTTTTLTVTPSRRRADFSGAAALGGSVSFVQTPETLIWLQSVAKVHVTFPRKPTEKDSAAVVFKGAPDAKPKSKTEFTHPESGQRFRLALTPNPEWRQPELAYPLLAALFAGLNDTFPPGFDVAGLTAFLVSEGLPKAYELSLVDADGDAVTLLARNTVAALEFLKVDDAVFAPPEGYTAWSVNGKAPDGAPEGYTQIPPHEASADDRPVARKPHGDIDREPGPQPPRPPHPPHPGPTPVPDTTAPRIGFRLEQRLLTHLSQLVNTALTPITTVTVAQGRIDFDWLNQLRTSVVRRGSRAPGTAIFRLLHDVDLPAQPPQPPAQPPDPASDYANFSCRGLVDQMALRDAEQRFRAGTYPDIILRSLPPTTQTLLSASGRDWDRVQDGNKARLAFELLRREYATLSIPFPTSTGDKPIMDLLNISADNIAGMLTLPPVPSPAPGTPLFNPLLTLTAGPSGNIMGSLSLGTLALTATVSRWPTANYWLLLVGGSAAALIVPGLAWVVPLLVSLTAFIAADVVSASLRVTGLTAAFNLSFGPNARGVLTPVVTCSLGGAVIFEGMSVVPTGIDQILAAIESAIVNALQSTILQALANGLAGMIQNLAETYLGDGFPASALHLDLPITGGRVGGSAGAYSYVETELSSANQLPFAITPVPAPGNLEHAQLLDVQRVTTNPPPEHYISLSMDQNFVNVALTAMRVAERFTGDWRGSQITQALGPGWPAPLPARGAISRITLRPEVGPSLQLYSNLAAGQIAHGDLTADYVLRLFRPQSVVAAQLRFRVSTRGQIILGSAFSPGEGTPFIQFQTLGARLFDLLVHSGGVVTLLGYDLVTTQRTTTTETWFDEGGKPHTQTLTETEEVLSAVPLSAAASQALATLAATAFQTSLMFRSPLRAPRIHSAMVCPPNNQVVSPDPVVTLRYLFDDGDPNSLACDHSLSNLHVDIGLDHALAHYHVNLTGLATFPFMPALTNSTVPMLATLNTPWAVGVLTNVKVRASTTREGFLSL